MTLHLTPEITPMLNRNENENHVINENTMVVDQEDVNPKLTYGIDKDVSTKSKNKNKDG